MIARGNVPLDWAMGILKRETEGGLYGNVVFTMKNGLIVCAKTEKNEIPPLDPSAKKA